MPLMMAFVKQIRQCGEFHVKGPVVAMQRPFTESDQNVRASETLMMLKRRVFRSDFRPFDVRRFHITGERFERAALIQMHQQTLPMLLWWSRPWSVTSSVLAFAASPQHITEP
jgi:hypothetical protein